jgi:hypothetical protein
MRAIVRFDAGAGLSAVGAGACSWARRLLVITDSDRTKQTINVFVMAFQLLSLLPLFTED